VGYLVRPERTARHSALAVHVVFALHGTRPRGCTVFESNMRLRVVATGRAMYPDVSMVCGAIAYDAEDAALTTITNPALLVDVVADANKWMHYQRIPSLREYVLVSEHPRVEVFRRTSSGTWEYFEVSDGTVSLDSGATLDLAVLYADLPA
jgi:Uma2 family endonuclease